ncbi:DUF6252 family protein [Adhaeribacter soli]|nr:DUF6252 family protein [Adhaeribacter soli]
MPASPGTIKARVNGFEKSTLANSTDAQTTSIVRMEISGVTDKGEMISIVLPTINKPGVYDSIAVGRYMVYSGDNPNDLVWTASSAKLTVTKFDMVERKISGTFSFQATPAPNSNSTGMKVLTEGTFTDVHIR